MPACAAAQASPRPRDPASLRASRQRWARGPESIRRSSSASTAVRAPAPRRPAGRGTPREEAAQEEAAEARPGGEAGGSRVAVAAWAGEEPLRRARPRRSRRRHVRSGAQVPSVAVTSWAPGAAEARRAAGTDRPGSWRPSRRAPPHASRARGRGRRLPPRPPPAPPASARRWRRHARCASRARPRSAAPTRRPPHRCRWWTGSRPCPCVVVPHAQRRERASTAPREARAGTLFRRRSRRRGGRRRGGSPARRRRRPS